MAGPAIDRTLRARARPQQDLVRSVLCLAFAVYLLGNASISQAQDNSQGAWRVECAGDGKTLECRAVQQLINRENKQLVAQLTARIVPDSKAPDLTIQLPLGLNLAEPVQLKVDNGPVEKLPVQTCKPAGCLATMPLNDKFLAAMRSGSVLKITMQDSNKRSLTFDVPLLGFGLALDKTK